MAVRNVKYGTYDGSLTYATLAIMRKQRDAVAKGGLSPSFVSVTRGLLDELKNDMDSLRYVAFDQSPPCFRIRGVRIVEAKPGETPDITQADLDAIAQTRFDLREEQRRREAIREGKQ